MPAGENRPLKILHVIRGLANSSGTTHIVVPLSEKQALLGCQVTIFHVRKGNEPPVEPRRDLVESCCFSLSLPFDNPGISFEFIKVINRRIAEFDFVHIHAVWNFPTYYAMRVALRAGVPYMVAPQGSFEPWAMQQNRWGKKFYGQITEMPLLRRATCLQALTEKEAEQFREHGIKAPAAIIPNGINENCFQRSAPQLTQRLGLSPDQKTLLFLSRVHPKKGLDVLVEAFAQFSTMHPGVTLIIAGHDGDSGYLETVRGLISSRGLEDRCRLIGEVSGADKYEIFLGADAFVLPSHSEGLPVAVLEAMGAGLPVVITEGCNIPEVQNRQAGFVVRTDSGEVANALEELFSDYPRALQMGENGKKLVKEKFSWSGIARETISIYKKMLSREGHSN